MHVEKQIEFDKIKEIWAELAITEGARQQIKNTTFYLQELELRKQLRDTTDSREMIEKLGNPPLQDIEEIKEILNASEKGDCLTPYQLERVQRVLVMLERLKDYLGRGKAFLNPLAYYDENIEENPDLKEEIRRQIRNEMVDDHATKELFDIRMQIQKCEEQMKQRAEQVIRNQKDCMADTYYTIRNGRVCVPVKKEYKLKVSGSVIDKSSTGSTLFMEPTSVAKYFEELQLLKIEEENEVYKILYTLTAMVYDIAAFMRENMKLIEKLDFIFSKGKLSLELDCVEPTINLERRIILEEARHPLMDKSVNVPLQFRLGDNGRENNKHGSNERGNSEHGSNERGSSKHGSNERGSSEHGSNERGSSEYGNNERGSSEHGSNERGSSEHGNNERGIVITGPNTGGKTVAIKTVMLNCLMAQCGLHVTCKSADICMNSAYLCDIGDGQNLAENLSTFSAHIKNVLSVLKEVDKDSFVIMDELGSGTDPAEGMGIAIAILEELRKSGANFLVTTHYPEVKEYAERTENIVNARMTFDKETLMPTYQMIIGEAGESCAFYIADRLGMPVEMLKVAISAAYGEDAVENYRFQSEERSDSMNKVSNGKISRIKKPQNQTKLTVKFDRGDSVMIYPDHKIGIVCEPVNEKGVLRVQLKNKKIWINHKRVKLHVKAEELYPEDYDFSIIFDTVENRKARHNMDRKFTNEVIQHES